MDYNIDQTSKRMIDTSRVISYFWIALIFLIGLVLRLSSSAMLEFFDIAISARIQSFLTDTGVVFLSTAFATLVATKVQERTNLSFFREVTAHALSRIFQPIIESSEEGAHKNYRWFCSLSAIEDNTHFINRHIHKSFTINRCPKDLRVIYAVSSAPAALAAYYDDKRYALRWGEAIGKDFTHDLNNLDHYSIPSVKLNGTALRIIKTKDFEVEGGKAKEFIFKVEKKSIGFPCTISIDLAVIKHIGSDSSFEIKSTIFHNALDAELDLIIDPRIKIVNIDADLTGITKAHAREHNLPEYGVIQDGDYFLRSYARFRFPIKENSPINFRLTR